MVDSRNKGYRAEAQLKKFLTHNTKEKWERIPASGALSAVHGLKGDLYIPNKDNAYCVEVKSYKESAINHNLVAGVGKPLVDWIEQSLRQGKQVDKKPLLIFKHDRSKWFVCDWVEPANLGRWMVYNYDPEELPVYIALLTDWLEEEDIKWVKNS
jgi:Holliday junction resolvase